MRHPCIEEVGLWMRSSNVERPACLGARVVYFWHAGVLLRLDLDSKAEGTTAKPGCKHLSRL